MGTDTFNISIICPVFNEEGNISQLIESLMEQINDTNEFEILIVDNNSTDNTVKIIQKYPVKLVSENSTQSSYAARNKGLKHAKGEVIAFIDSDCIASPEWIKEGIEALVAEDADMVGGNVQFYYSEERTAAELYDSIMNMQMEHNIRERNVAKTANLFVRTEVFKKIGLFPDDVQSGGDVQWTGKATQKGFKLVYAPKAVVYHPARKLNELIKKQHRVGKGFLSIWKKEHRSIGNICYESGKFLIPWPPSVIKGWIDQRGTPDMMNKFWGIWCVTYVCNLAMFFGIAASVIEAAFNYGKY
ncbi:glycosyltransferase [Methanocalculus sp.]|uniref:glycosyltransferase n=1 Tax=Methanocalculus sp. TaxID=2004547 RepID=UPI0026075904|nr:glycosyltransferase [Methanocalculus sp.]MDG6250544.1 glycosyltransferase [Methanocalculus sp.]